MTMTIDEPRHIPDQGHDLLTWQGEITQLLPSFDLTFRRAPLRQDGCIGKVEVENKVVLTSALRGCSAWQ
jgi:hypothetical protein